MFLPQLIKKLREVRQAYTLVEEKGDSELQKALETNGLPFTETLKRLVTEYEEMTSAQLKDYSADLHAAIEEWRKSVNWTPPPYTPHPVIVPGKSSPYFF